jgi:hypothetical protein
MAAGSFRVDTAHILAFASSKVNAGFKCFTYFQNGGQKQNLPDAATSGRFREVMMDQVSMARDRPSLVQAEIGLALAADELRADFDHPPSNPRQCGAMALVQDLAGELKLLRFLDQFLMVLLVDHEVGEVYHVVLLLDVTEHFWSP